MVDQDADVFDDGADAGDGSSGCSERAAPAPGALDSSRGAPSVGGSSTLAEDAMALGSRQRLADHVIECQSSGSESSTTIVKNGHDILEQRRKADVENMEPLMRALKGQLETGVAAPVDHPGGMPRRWSKLRSFADVVDVDPVALSLWFDQPMPQLPRSQQRVRPNKGGRIVIIRDTSLSMMGPWNDWSALLCPKIVELARSNRMRVGYLEFNSDVDKFVFGDSQLFFSRRYDELCSRMSHVMLRGFTNYERPLNVALSEFRRRGSEQMQRPRPNIQVNPHGGSKAPCDQHIVFITDGHPTSGDRALAREIATAQALRVAVHTIFIGQGECPPVLDDMSLRTNGSRHMAHFDKDSRSVKVMERSRA